MDIRNFFKRPRLETNNEASASNSSENPEFKADATSLGSYTNASVSVVEPEAIPFSVDKFDIGQYVNISLSAEKKIEVFDRIWAPERDFNFKKIGEKRSFRFEWLKTYEPWLAYSKIGSGAYCKFCVLFKQKVHRGLQGSFIKTPFTKFKDFNECAKKHTETEWHKYSLAESTHLLAIKNQDAVTIASAISQARADTISRNREILGSIVRTIVFCGTHDIALRGKETGRGNFRDLLKFRIQAGDTVLKNHLETGPRNAQYTSIETEHEIIRICEEIIANDIVSKANASKCFSILADETCDISGDEQLSFGIRFPDFAKNRFIIREEFLGFVLLKKFDANSIAEAILDKCDKLNLNMEFCTGQGYDGCAAMAGNENGVKAIIQRKYPYINFVHCSNHRLNLVVHDLNKLPEIRNTIGSVKEIISFFRESNIRRQLLPSIPMLCETRWTEKHKTIGLFKTHFKKILDQLNSISLGSSNGKHKGFSLYCAATKPVFIICLFVMAKYSEILGPISVLLQHKQINLLECQNHIRRLISIFHEEREKFSELYQNAYRFCEDYGIDLSIPRIVGRQSQRANYPTTDPEEYYKLSIFLPYIDSIVSSLQIRFSEENTRVFNLFKFHPSVFKTLNASDRKQISRDMGENGNLENHEMTWFKIVNEDNCTDMDSIIKAAKFVPDIQKLLLKSFSLPVTTATVERSFSTLRRVKTWVRSMVSESRLSGLCMLSTHRSMIEEDEDLFISKVIDAFAQDERRLVFLFNK